LSEVGFWPQEALIPLGDRMLFTFFRIFLLFHRMSDDPNLDPNSIIAEIKKKEQEGVKEEEMSDCKSFSISFIFVFNVLCIF
jgi:hypothetical protein